MEEIKQGFWGKAVLREMKMRQSRKTTACQRFPRPIETTRSYLDPDTATVSTAVSWARVCVRVQTASCKQEEKQKEKEAEQSMFREKTQDDLVSKDSAVADIP
mmetsp:Transcript_6988/g.13725  ORF Transcript_6988/g.13725 Transcript_6988/m.13725 type:complete len:103 (+) Transcript_6988:873-1181(+)